MTWGGFLFLWSLFCLPGLILATIKEVKRRRVLRETPGTLQYLKAEHRKIQRQAKQDMGGWS